MKMCPVVLISNNIIHHVHIVFCFLGREVKKLKTGSMRNICIYKIIIHYLIRPMVNYYMYFCAEYLHIN